MTVQHAEVVPGTPAHKALLEAAPDLLAALQAVSLTVACHAARYPGDVEAQRDLLRLRKAIAKATRKCRFNHADHASFRMSGQLRLCVGCGHTEALIDGEWIAGTKPITSDTAHGGHGGGMGDAAAALPVPGMTVGNELHSRPVTYAELGGRGGATLGTKVDVFG